MHPLAPDIPDSFPAKAAFGGRAVQIFIALALGIVLASSLDYRFGFSLAASGAAFALFGAHRPHSLHETSSLAARPPDSAGADQRRLDRRSRGLRAERLAGPGVGG